jgi:hypothetical protein
MEKIFWQQQLIGLRIKRTQNGTNPLTESAAALQVLSLKQKAGYRVDPHLQTGKKRTTAELGKAIVVIKGKVRIDLYSPTKKFFKKVLLSSGQCFVLLKGGWSITFLEPSEIFEFKNGPFVQDKILID